MTVTKTLALAAMSLMAAAAPMSVQQDASSGLYRITTTCASAQTSVIGDGEVAPNAGCEPAWEYVCTTPTKDYEDKRPI